MDLGIRPSLISARYWQCALLASGETPIRSDVQNSVQKSYRARQLSEYRAWFIESSKICAKILYFNLSEWVSSGCETFQQTKQEGTCCELYLVPSIFLSNFLATFQITEYPQSQGVIVKVKLHIFQKRFFEIQKRKVVYRAFSIPENILEMQLSKYLQVNFEAGSLRARTGLGTNVFGPFLQKNLNKSWLQWFNKWLKIFHLWYSSLRYMWSHQSWNIISISNGHES